jgi:beta-glucosidase
MGLFENPKGTRPDLLAAVGCETHRQANLELARESVVLLQNPDNLLPLDPSKNLNIAVLGPNADNDQMHLGDWASASGQMNKEGSRQPRELTVTLKDGLERIAPDHWTIRHEPGCGIAEEQTDLLEPALQAAREADVIVVGVGDDLHLIGEYKSTGTLELQGGQIRLLEELSRLDKPLILVLLHSKPNVLPRCIHERAVILEAFSPGMMGGQALAEIIAGQVNPSGHLTVSVPYHVGQQPIYYSQVRGQHGDTYADLTQSPHFAFGEGLSYTSFALRDLEIDRENLSDEDTLQIRVTLENTGARAGADVVQLYVSDVVTSATWVQKELKDFRKVYVEAGERQTLDFTLPASACSIVNAAGKRIVEPGEFKLELALSSRDPDALTRIFHITHPS